MSRLGFIIAFVSLQVLFVPQVYSLGHKGNGFVVEHWRAPYLSPTSDNVFMLLGCSTQSPLFQGFPYGKHSPCRNVSGMGCEEYYGCQGWMDLGLARMGLAYGTGPPVCCSLPFDAIKSVNLSKLECQGYSSAYTLAPLRVSGPSEWTYGIRVKYDIETSNDSYCKACEATGGSCGHDVDRFGRLCMCGSWNSTSNCDKIMKLSVGGTSSPADKLSGLFIATTAFWMDLVCLVIVIHILIISGKATSAKISIFSEATSPDNHMYAIDRTLNIMSGVGTSSKKATLDEPASTKDLKSSDSPLFLDELQGNAIHCSARSNVAHNFIKLKKEVIYCIKNFVAHPNKEEYRIRKDDAFMLEFNDATNTQKSLAKGAGFVRHHVTPHQGGTARCNILINIIQDDRYKHHTY
nr:wall-associated receptor kinase galacturonan-binding domain-containing protein [Tanacetum cinerariifolium]